jgi:diguanylate cyclase (GGDEF)-like protein
MLELLEHAFRAARRSGNTSAVFFLDLDRFKQVNDSYGNQVGDELLVAVAQRLTGAIRPGDSLARLSGDEFVILCVDLADQSERVTASTRLRSSCATPIWRCTGGSSGRGQTASDGSASNRRRSRSQSTCPRTSSCPLGSHRS